MFSKGDRLRTAWRARPRGSFNFELLESRILLSSTIESIDGTGNNLKNTAWGAAGTDLIRLAAAAYADGVDSPALSADQSARAISNILNSQADPNNPAQDLLTIDRNSVSDFGYAFGQFMDHDLDLTPDGGSEFDIAVSATDPIGPNNLPFTRSVTDPATGAANAAQQVTTVTAYLDLSQVYGSSQIVADALRTHSGGRLKTSPGNMLPYDNSTYFTTAQIAALNMANDAGMVSTNQLFAAGDVRANENLELTALQTLFMRNHNRIAGELQALHPQWTDEQVYQEARKLNIAEYQNIIYNGWIPAVLGGSALTRYTGYKPNVNASISNEFSTVAFRFGHSLVSGTIERQNNDGSDVATVNPDGADISLAQDFFDPNLLNPNGVVDPLTNQTSTDIGPILKGEAGGIENANDLMAVNDIRNLLFGAGAGGDDLMARDIQRGRDNGIPNYNTLRVAVGLKPVTSFAQISSNPAVRAQLAAAYPGGVGTIDAFEGGLAEDHVPGSDVGPLFQKILADQFQRLRDGDRFFYLNESFNREEMMILSQGTSLTAVIEANTPVTHLQANVFIFSASISGTVAAGPAAGHAMSTAMNGLAGVTVELVDDEGHVVGTTITDRNGHYTFSTPTPGSNRAAAITGTGSYQVVVLPPAGATLLSPLAQTVVISSGDTQVNGVDFLVTLPGSNPIQGPLQPPAHHGPSGNGAHH